MAAIRVVGMLLALATAAAAQEPARVVGRVTDPLGNPVKGATLELVDDRGDARASTASGETGGFEFARLPAGEYTLRAARDGFRQRTTRLSVAAGERRIVVTRLRPERAAPDTARTP
jgi:protocatechuate 3,4-dioxygenase beta subunit